MEVLEGKRPAALVSFPDLSGAEYVSVAEARGRRLKELAGRENTVQIIGNSMISGANGLVDYADDRDVQYVAAAIVPFWAEAELPLPITELVLNEHNIDTFLEEDNEGVTRLEAVLRKIANDWGSGDGPAFDYSIIDDVLRFSPSFVIKDMRTQTTPKAPVAKSKSVETKGSSGSKVHGADTTFAGLNEDGVRDYLKLIAKYPLLDKEGEQRLAKIIKDGVEASKRLANESALSSVEERRLRRAIQAGEHARVDFINANYRLVVSIAKKYQASGMPLLDLIQEGNMGMAHAVDKFDAEKGFKFSTYATWWIRQAITRAIANQGELIRLPVHAVEDQRRYSKTFQALTAKYDRDPTDEELIKELEWDKKKLQKVRRSFKTNTPTSLDATLREDGDATMYDIVATPHEDGRAEKNEHRVELLAKILPMILFTDKERQEAAKRLATSARSIKSTSQDEFKLPSTSVLLRIRHPAVVAKIGHEEFGSKGLEWTKDAYCKPLPAQDFLQVEDIKSFQKASECCFACPVRESCLEQAKRLKPREGIWGGKYFSTRESTRLPYFMKTAIKDKIVEATPPYRTRSAYKSLL